MDLQLTMAIDVASRAHKGQVRKYTGEPYLTHPFAVAGLVASVTGNDSMIVAAILHDVVEDTDVRLDTIRGLFGKDACNLVDDLTDVSCMTDGNRAERKRIDREHTAEASQRAKTIKLADLIDNTKSITACDKKFAKIYMAEKRLLLEVLTEGDPVLFAIAERMIKEWYDYKKKEDTIKICCKGKEHLCILNVNGGYCCANSCQFQVIERIK